jgi:hypothetical protein
MGELPALVVNTIQSRIELANTPGDEVHAKAGETRGARHNFDRRAKAAFPDNSDRSAVPYKGMNHDAKTESILP